MKALNWLLNLAILGLFIGVAAAKQAPVAEARARLGTGGRAVVNHVNEMGDEVFKLISVEYLVDAQPIFQKADPGELAALKEIEVFNDNIGPGTHKLSVQMVYQGRPVWIFSYVEGYKFKVSSSYDFTAEQGKTVNVRVVGFDKGGWLSKLEDRPAIKYDFAVEDQSSTATPSS